MASRLQQLQHILSSSGSEPIVRIGDAELRVDLRPANPELVPSSPAVLLDESQETLGHLRWMIQKGNLQQDMFLTGNPGPFRRQLALFYAQLGNREMEYVSLSRDVTDADLKQ
ncbi:hypothetical protein HDU91_002655, partial [Kappamyces sp. JEL0680]